jgi:hypothetical protein
MKAPAAARFKQPCDNIGPNTKGRQAMHHDAPS